MSWRVWKEWSIPCHTAECIPIPIQWCSSSPSLYFGHSGLTSLFQGTKPSPLPYSSSCSFSFPKWFNFLPEPLRVCSLAHTCTFQAGVQPSLEFTFWRGNRWWKSSLAFCLPSCLPWPSSWLGWQWFQPICYLILSQRALRGQGRSFTWAWPHLTPHQAPSPLPVDSALSLRVLPAGPVWPPQGSTGLPKELGGLWLSLLMHTGDRIPRGLEKGMEAPIWELYWPFSPANVLLKTQLMML